jgi:DNA-binding MarR family transcriptional regulator
MQREHASPDSAQYAEMVAEVFMETLRKSSGRLACPEGDADLTPALMECLQYVYLHGPAPIRQIAGGLQISLSAVSQLVDRLVRKGMVTRGENEQDRRLTSIELTEAGRESVRQMRRRKSEWFDGILEAMPHSQRRAFREGLESFLKIALRGEDGVERACARCSMEHAAFCVVNKVRSKRITEESEL